jgi:metal-responsive CopG/Arc/MetJ family transcriptional regulator
MRRSKVSTTGRPRSAEGVPLQVRLPADLVERITKAAAEDDRSRNSWIARACRAALREGRTMGQECAICAAAGHATEGTVEITYDRVRDGLPERPVYACVECAAMIESTSEQ